MEKMVKLECVKCKTEFEFSKKHFTYRIKKNPNTKFFCGMKCRINNQSTLVSFNCKECKKSFERNRAQIIREEIKFCSQSCSAKFNNVKRKENGYTLKGKTKKTNCCNCKADIIVRINASTEFSKCKNCTSDKNKIRNGIKTTKHCKNCNKEILTLEAMYCIDCRHLLSISSGKRLGQFNGTIRRSKNEIYFAELCQKHFLEIKINTCMFNGWDADVIIEDNKHAVLWNGIFHYKKVKAGQSLLQIQTRDRLKLKEIANCGYIAYIIKDMGKHNKKFVEEQFAIFLQYLKR